MFRALFFWCLFAPTLGTITEFDKVSFKLEKVDVHLLHDHSNKSYSADNDPTPVVFWHGMGDTAYGSINIERLALQKKFPGMRVYSVQIGSNAIEDELAGYFANVNDQIEQVCEQILNNSYIKNHGSLNVVGFSQGGQFVRGLVQRCPFYENQITVKNLITLGGQHQGVFGLPRCPSSATICNYVRYLLSLGAYNKQVQDHLVQAEYWHDPINEDEYKEKNVFLSDINNELSINETYKTNLLRLDNFVMVKFEQDEMVMPPESSLFGFYEPGQTKNILKLRESKIYLEDRLGLKQLDESKRLIMIGIPGHHLQYKMAWFLEKVASVYLNN